MAAAAGEVAALRGTRAGRREMVQQAIVDMFSALLHVQGGGQGADLFLEVLRSLAADGLDVEDDTLYDDPTPRDTARAGSTIPESVAAAGLGAVGRVHPVASLWRRSVPSGLRAIDRRGIRKAGTPRRTATSGPPQLSAMFRSLHEVIKGVKPTEAPASATMFLRPKSSTKCRCLLNATRINEMDSRAPPKVKLPTLSEISDHFATQPPGKLWMCKLDLSNAYWSIRLPRPWRCTFVIAAGRRRWRYTSLPFGWKYSAVIRQRPVRGIVSRALEGMPVTWHVYVDDVLVTARSKGMAASVIRKAAAAMRDTGFIISPKSKMEPSTEITFLGKRLDSVVRSITNTRGMLMATMRLWVPALGSGRATPREAVRLLGRL